MQDPLNSELPSIAHSADVSEMTTTKPGILRTIHAALADKLDYITVSAPFESHSQPRSPRPVDKASHILGITHHKSMEPIPASTRMSVVSAHSAPSSPTQHAQTLLLTSLRVVSGLPKSPHTWTLADPDAVLVLSHSGGTVARWWRPEVLGSTTSPGAGGGKKKKKANKGESTEILKGAGALSKAEVGKSYQKRSRHVSFVWLLSLLITFSYSSHSGVKLKSLHQRFSRRAQCIHLHLPFPRLHLLKWVCFVHLSLLERIVLPQPHVLLSFTLMTHSSMPVLHQLTSVHRASSNLLQHPRHLLCSRNKHRVEIMQQLPTMVSV
jgi:hypothetical protein